MSLDLIKKNSSSPFHLQRSMVDQGGEGGAYEQGGFNPNIVYNNDAANAAIESFGKTIGAALASRTKEDRNESDVKTKARLDKKEKQIKDNSFKNLTNDRAAQRERSDNKLARIDKRQERVEGRIKKYEESARPKFQSQALDDFSKNAAAKKVETKKPESKPGTDYTKLLSNSQVVEKFKGYKFK